MHERARAGPLHLGAGRATTSGMMSRCRTVSTSSALAHPAINATAAKIWEYRSYSRNGPRRSGSDHLATSRSRGVNDPLFVKVPRAYRQRQNWSNVRRLADIQIRPPTLTGRFHRSRAGLMRRAAPERSYGGRWAASGEREKKPDDCRPFRSSSSFGGRRRKDRHRIQSKPTGGSTIPEERVNPPPHSLRSTNSW